MHHVAGTALISILAGFLACAVTSFSLGLSAVRLLRLDLNRAEAVCFAYVLGSAATSMLVFGAAVLWIAWEWVFLVVTAAALVLLWREAPWLRRLKAASLATIPIPARVVFLAALLAYGLIYFRQAVSPELSPDGMAYHLGLVNLWNHDHGLSRNITMYAALPGGMEMLFLFAFAIGRHSAAALVHFSFLMLLPCLMVLYGCRFGWRRGGAVLAALLVFASPLVGIDGASAYNDVALAVFVFATLWLLDIWRQERSASLLIALGLLAGFAFAVKYTAGFLVLYVMAVIVWELRRAPRLAPRAVLITALAMSVCALPWLIRNVVWFQNPIAFVGNDIFPNRWFHVSFEKKYEYLERVHSGLRWRDLPRELTVGGPNMQEAFGPGFALVGLALLGVIWPRTRFLLLAAILMVFPFNANKVERFLIPMLPPAMMITGYAIGRIPGSSLLIALLALAQLVISWPRFDNRFEITSGWRIRAHIPWQLALRGVSDEEYLNRNAEYELATLVEKYVPDRKIVLVMSDPIAQSYTTRVVIKSWESALTEKMSWMIWEAGTFPGRGRIWTASFPESAVRELRLTQTAKTADLNTVWSINEIQPWLRNARISPSPQWRATAAPFPWDAAPAVDGSLATPWRSWEALRPGMWFDVRFNRAETMDRVEVISVSPQWPTMMKASVLTDRGQWIPAAASFWREYDLPDIRKAAMQEMKRNGVEYFEISSDFWKSHIFQGDYAAWGVHLVASTPRSLLIRVD
ncbi:MAG TPA: glycosyltransferase family 39 protein [Bryobacteraceae bacterium]|nr:glycosyltransferase family 39 protein [Bryobacteraceae bacterium]